MNCLIFQLEDGHCLRNPGIILNAYVSHVLSCRRPIYNPCDNTFKRRQKLAEHRWAVVTPCEQDGQQLLCVTTEGAQVAISPPSSGISCAPLLAAGLLLSALSLDYDRVIVHQPGFHLLPMHYHSTKMEDVVFNHPGNGSMTTVWAASPHRHRRFFELGCELLDVKIRKGIASLEDLFYSLSFGAAFFPISVTPSPPPPTLNPRAHSASHNPPDNDCRQF